MFSLPVMKNEFESVTGKCKYSINKLVLLKIRRGFMKKRAILFGIFHYNRSASITANDLPSTEIDVKTLEKRLKQLQFETVSYMDICLKDMEQKITEFADTAPCDSLNVVYFSGHGGHSKGENYLYPVDFGNSLDARMSIEDSAFNLKRIQPLFKRKVKLLIIVDACRDKLKPDYACNYSEMVAPQDTYIAYATQFGDCSGCTPSISYFTEALCDNILTPNISVDRLFTDVRAALYLKHGRQISNSVNGFMSDISLNEQADHDKVGNLVLQFVDHYGDMYVDKYGPFAGDDLVFIDAAQYCGISVLDAIYKFQKLDAERCHVTDSLSESHKKLIAFWGMLGNGLEQDEFYTWKYRGRPIRLGEIPPLPLDMQKPMPDAGKEIEVDFKLDIKHDGIYISTNLPDNYQLFGKINGRYSFNNIVVKSGNAQIPLSDKISEVYAVDLYSVVPTVSGVDSSIIGEKARNLVGQYVKFSPISGNSIEFHYKK